MQNSLCLVLTCNRKSLLAVVDLFTCSLSMWTYTVRNLFETFFIFWDKNGRAEFCIWRVKKQTRMITVSFMPMFCLKLQFLIFFIDLSLKRSQWSQNLSDVFMVNNNMAIIIADFWEIPAASYRSQELRVKSQTLLRNRAVENTRVHLCTTSGLARLI